MHSGEWEGHYWTCCWNRDEQTTFCKIVTQEITPAAVAEANPKTYLNALERAKLAEQEAADAEVREQEEAAIEEEIKKANIRKRVNSSLWDKQSEQEEGEDNWIEAEEKEAAAKQAAREQREREA